MIGYLSLFSLALLPAASGASPLETLRAENVLAFEITAPEPKPDILGTCPRSKAINQTASDPNEASSLKGVTEVEPEMLPLPEDDLEKESLLNALATTLTYWKKRPNTFTIIVGKDTYTAVQMRATTQKLIDLLSADMTTEELHTALKTQFRVYRSVAEDNSGKIILTGYYEAEVPASRQQDSVYKFPIYIKPPDLVKVPAALGMDFDYGRKDENGNLLRYYSRQEISSGVLTGKGLELVWTAHPSQIMLLQIQGSGILRFPDGDFIKTGFDGANGWPFKSVQKILLDCGEIPDMSFKDFIGYLSTQGARESLLVDLNPRYVFFKSLPKDTPAYGAMGRALTPGRSIAVDPAPLPLGITALIKAKKPVAGPAGGLSFKDFSRFVTAQDTGSAIRGPGRIDLFWGAGAVAETEASSMKTKGDLFVLIAK